MHMLYIFYIVKAKIPNTNHDPLMGFSCFKYIKYTDKERSPFRNWGYHGASAIVFLHGARKIVMLQLNKMKKHTETLFTKL